MNKRDFDRGFSIVELLVIVVVVGVLATVATNYYKSSASAPTKTIKDTAVDVVLINDLKNVSNILKLSQIGSDDESFPTTLDQANGVAEIKASEGVTLQYIVDNESNPKTFCITATKNGTSYMIDNTTHTTATEGTCPELKK